MSDRCFFDMADTAFFQPGTYTDDAVLSGFWSETNSWEDRNSWGTHDDDVIGWSIRHYYTSTSTAYDDFRLMSVIGSSVLWGANRANYNGYSDLRLLRWKFASEEDHYDSTLGTRDGKHQFYFVAEGDWDNYDGYIVGINRDGNGDFHLSLGHVTGANSYAELATAPMPFTMDDTNWRDLVMSARCIAERTGAGTDLRIRAKFWLEADPEPSSWDLDYTVSDAVEFATPVFGVGTEDATYTDYRIGGWGVSIDPAMEAPTANFGMKGLDINETLVNNGASDAPVFDLGSVQDPPMTPVERLVEIVDALVDQNSAWAKVSEAFEGRYAAYKCVGSPLGSDFYVYIGPLTGTGSDNAIVRAAEKLEVFTGAADYVCIAGSDSQDDLVDDGNGNGVNGGGWRYGNDYYGPLHSWAASPTLTLGSAYEYMIRLSRNALIIATRSGTNISSALAGNFFPFADSDAFPLALDDALYSSTSTRDQGGGGGWSRIPGVIGITPSGNDDVHLQTYPPVRAEWGRPTGRVGDVVDPMYGAVVASRVATRPRYNDWETAGGNRGVLQAIVRAYVDSAVSWGDTVNIEGNEYRYLGSGGMWMMTAETDDDA